MSPPCLDLSESLCRVGRHPPLAQEIKTAAGAHGYIDTEAFALKVQQLQQVLRSALCTLLAPVASTALTHLLSGPVDAPE